MTGLATPKDTKGTFNQIQSLRHHFYQNGLYLPTRTIVLGTNQLVSEDEKHEFTQIDFVDFLKNLHILENEAGSSEDENLIKILLFSAGGDMYLGFGFYDAIKACKSPVEIRAIGMVMSMGTVILQAADYRYAYPNTTFMIHNGIMDPGIVNVVEAEVETDQIRRMVERMVDIYESTMTVKRDEIEEMLADTTYMDANKAKKLGLIDGVKERFDL